MLPSHLHLTFQQRGKNRYFNYRLLTQTFNIIEA